MRRISIIGSGGAGKSTLAIRLGSLLNIPVFHLDSLYWKPGWIETDHKDWAKLQESLCNKDSWIIDGNYGGTLDIRLKASDTVIFLDINRYACLFNVIKRTLKYHRKSRPDMGAGCPERLETKFLKWIHGYPVNKRPDILKKLIALEGNLEVYVLKDRREVNHFLNDLQKTS